MQSWAFDALPSNALQPAGRQFPSKSETSMHARAASGSQYEAGFKCWQSPAAAGEAQDDMGQ